MADLEGNKIGRLIELYTSEKAAIQQSQFRAELEWQLRRNPDAFAESEFLCQAAWVILCAGFKESVLRKTFNYLSLCFCDWESARTIVEKAELCRATALKAFRHSAKIDAIIEVARIVDRVGFEDFVEWIRIDPVGSLEQLPYVGPVTAYHLAKNLGFLCAKPDRHLTRIAAIWGFDNVHQLCEVISENTSDPVPLVDIVLWRSAEQGRLLKRTALS